jgi:hypothetical protein
MHADKNGYREQPNKTTTIQKSFQKFNKKLMNIMDLSI